MSRRILARRAERLLQRGGQGGEHGGAGGGCSGCGILGSERVHGQAMCMQRMEPPPPLQARRRSLLEAAVRVVHRQQQRPYYCSQRRLNTLRPWVYQAPDEVVRMVVRVMVSGGKRDGQGACLHW